MPLEHTFKTLAKTPKVLVSKPLNPPQRYRLGSRSMIEGFKWGLNPGLITSVSAEQNTSSYDQTPECRHVWMRKPQRHMNTHTQRLSGQRRGSDQQEITPTNKSNTRLTAEEGEIRSSSMHSSSSHQHWRKLYHHMEYNSKNMDTFSLKKKKRAQ